MMFAIGLEMGNGIIYPSKTYWSSLLAQCRTPGVQGIMLMPIPPLATQPRDETHFMIGVEKLEKKGYVHLYTGTGKGKTTAAFGLALRAACAGMRVYIGQFVKGMKYSELKVQDYIPNITIEQYGRDCFIETEPTPEDIQCAEIGFEKIKAALKSGAYDVVVIDEITVALYYRLISLEDLVKAIAGRNPKIEVVMTGRNAPPELIQTADLVTEMAERKHYYQQGIQAREGIEF